MPILEPYREVRSALWQKLLIVPVSLLIGGGGMMACLVSFVPAWNTTGRTGQVDAPGVGEPIMAVVMGVGLLAFGLCLLWTVFKYSIRADTEGITQTNGFFCQSVRWEEVASYYVEPNRRHHKERRLHVEPVLLNAEGTIRFQGFAPLFVSTKNIIRQRQELWQFVETQLEGKKVEAPSPDLDPEVLALRSLEVDWSKKSLLWKVGRIFALICYTLFWLSVSMAPIYYLVSHNITIAKPWGSLLVLPMFLGPLLPHLIWLHFKKRKIARQLQERETIK